MALWHFKAEQKTRIIKSYPQGKKIQKLRLTFMYIEN
jgi:hypothetical protein